MSEEPVAGSAEEPVVIQVTVGAPIETVWTHLREPDLIRRWHGWLADGLDSEIDYIFRRHARETGTPYVLQIDRGSEDGAWADGGDRFELRESEGGTTVRITRGARGPEEMWDAWYDDITEGWTSFLQQLRFTLDAQPENIRRTIFLNVDGVDLESVRTLLGLTRLTPGASYVVDAGDGLDLRGTGWFFSEHQVGVVGDSLGPGLLIAADKPGEQGASKGAMVILTTYGQDDADFARTVAQWGDWWQARYPDAEGPQT